MTIPVADCGLPARHTPPDTTTGRGGPMNDKIRAWVDARICQRCWKSVEAAADTVELHSWRGRMRGKGWLGS